MVVAEGPPSRAGGHCVVDRALGLGRVMVSFPAETEVALGRIVGLVLVVAGRVSSRRLGIGPARTSVGIWRVAARSSPSEA